MLSVPTPKLGDAGDTVVTDSPGGRQTWHQTRVVREEHRQRGRSWDGGSTGRGDRAHTGKSGEPMKASSRWDRRPAREGFPGKQRIPKPRPPKVRQGGTHAQRPGVVEAQDALRKCR